MAEYSYDAEMEKLKRRRMLAQALSAGGQMPQGQMVGNRFVAPHPLQQLAAVGQQLSGAWIDRNTNKQETSLKEKERARMAEVLRGLMKPGGVISEEGAMGIPSGGAGGTGAPKVDPQREAALAVLGDLPLEAQREIVGRQAASQLFPSQKEGFTLSPGQQRYDAQGRPIASAPNDVKSLLGTVSPDQYTSESLREFQKTGDYGVLKPRDGGQKLGNVNPGDFTPASLAKFLQSGNYSDLVRYVTPANPTVQIVGGVPTVVQPDRGGGAPTQAPLSTLDAEAAAKAELAAREAGAKTTATAEAERVAGAPKRIEKARQLTTSIDNTMNQIDTALKGTKWATTGIVGSMSKAVPGTDAYNLGQTLLTIKANIGFDRLQAMRDASPTGGALGQVAVQEIQALQATIASLDQAQSGSQLKSGLEQVKKHYDNWKRTVLQAEQAEPAQPGSPPPKNVDVKTRAKSYY